MLGVTGLELRRDLFYEKELTFIVSCSYGPGRYDKNYEDKCYDYPLPYVRWTEQRNFQSVLELIKTKKLNLNKLISHRFNLNEAKEAYDLILEKKKSLGIIIKFPHKETSIKNNIKLAAKKNNKKNYEKVNVGFIGAGNYARKILIPTFNKVGGKLITIASINGLNSVITGEKYGFQNATTNVDELINNPNCNAIVISTRHNSHAELIIKSLNAKKNIFVEKPLCLTKTELESIKKAYKGDTILMVGFNRRFSPLIQELRRLLHNLPEKKSFIYTCNAGFIDPTHWTQDKIIGG